MRKVTQGTRGRGDNKRGKRSAQTDGGDKQVGELPYPKSNSTVQKYDPDPDFQ